MQVTQMASSIVISRPRTDNETEPKASLSRIYQVTEVNAAKGETMLSLTIQNLGDVTVFQCSGRITADDKGVLQRAVLTQPHIRTAVLDLADVSAVDAAGLGMLVGLRSWAKATGTELKLMNITARVEEVLQVTRLRSAFEVCSVREMIDLLCRASRHALPLEATTAAVGQRI